MGGGKGGGNTWAGNQQSTVSIPPEVLARYNAVNARAENVAQNPFQTYDGSFVSPLNLAQNTATNNLFNSLSAYNPYYDTAQQFVWNGLNNSVPYYDTANQTIGGALGTASQYAGQGLGAIQGAFNAAQPFNAAASGLGNAAYASAQPFNAAASQGATSAYNSAQPLNAQASSQINQALSSAAPYMGYAGNLAMAGTGAVNPNNLDIARYFSPYNDAVVKSTLGLLDQQQAQQQNALKSNAIMAGAYGGDRSDIASAVLSGQQGLARSQVASDLYNQMYNQALGTAQQQQGLYLSADQANRAALASGASNLANIGNLGFNQGLGAAQGQMSLANNMFNQGLGAAGMQLQAGNQIYNQGMGNAGLQAQIGNQVFGQGYQTGTGIAGIGQGLGGLGLQGANQYQGLGQQAYNQGLGASAQFGNLAGQQNQMQLASAQALLGAGTVGQQTDQANLQAQYNQFLQQQAYPFQVAQFLANIAMGTGSLSGSTTTTSANQPQPFFSDERLKEDIREIGKTKDGIPIISFKYKGSPHTQIGMRAQDVEDVRPEAVGLAGGYKTVDYARATKRASGGLVPANDDGREGFAAGGYNGMMDPVMAQILAAHSGMYPGGAGRPGIDTTNSAGERVPLGPRGMQLASLPTGKLAVAQPMQLKQPEPGLKTALNSVNDVAGAVKTAGSLYDAGSDALVGRAEKVAKDGTVTPASGGLLGSGGKWSPESGWFGKQTGLGAANANAPGSITSKELPPISDPTAASAAPSDSAGVASAALRDAPVDESLVAAAEDIPVDDIVESALALAWRGGRMKRKAGGGMPYGGVDTYVPDEGTEDYSDNFKKSQALADEALADARRDQERGSGGGGKGGSAGGALKGAMSGAAAGSMFGPWGIAGGALLGGLGGSGLFNRGGRAGYDEGGGIDPDEARKIIDASERFGRERAGLDPVASIGANVVPFEPVPRNALLDRVHSTPDTSLRHTSLLPQDRLPSMPEYEWRNTVREAPPTAGLAPPSPPVTVPATPPSGARGSATVADAAVPGLNPSPPPVTPDQARAAVNQVASTISTPPSPGLNPQPPIQTPAGFRSPGGVDSPEDYLVRMQTQESGNNQFNPKTGAPVTSSAGAIGIMQVMPGTGPEAAKLAGLPWNPELFSRNRTGDPDKDREATDYNRALGRAYYLQQVKDFGDPAIAAAAYNAGPAAVRDAQTKAAASGGNYLDYLPKETRDYVAIVSGRGGRQDAVMSYRPENGQNGSQDSGGLGAAQNLQPTADATPKPRGDFLSRAGDFIDRNERPIMAGLSFLGNMLASPSRTLAGSIGSGLAAAAPQYLSAGFREKELGQGQQRIDITQNAQLMNTWSALRQKITMARANGLPVDPALAVQVDALEKLLMERVGKAAGAPEALARAGFSAPAALPAAGGTSGTPGSATAPAGSPATPRPLTGTSPNPAASPPPAKATRQWYEEPRYGFDDPAFLAQIPPDNNPFTVRQRAKEAATDDPTGQTTAMLNAKADRLLEMWQAGNAIGPGGGVITVPGAAEVEKWRSNIPINTAWSQGETEKANQRQMARTSTQAIGKILETYESGKWEDVKADVTAMGRALGFDPKLGSPDEFQQFIKNALDVTLRQAAAGGAPSSVTDSLRDQVASTFATPGLQPKANAAIIAKTLGALDWSDKQYQDTQGMINQYPGIDRGRYTAEWLRDNKPEQFIDAIKKDVAVMGGTPDTLGDLEVGQAYILTPEKVVQLFGGTLDEARKKLDGKRSVKVRWERQGDRLGFVPVK